MGNLFGTDTVITCPHGGRVRAVTGLASDAVLLDGLPVATASGAWTVTGCTHTTGSAATPCTSVRWSPGRDGVRVDGVPVLLNSTDAECFSAGLLPQGPPVVLPAHSGVSAG